MNYNPFSLTGKTILITGASSGIGKSCAIECSKAGAKLIITGRNEQRLHETLNHLWGDKHQSVIADVSNDEGLNTLLSAIPKLDGVILAAGIVEMWPVLFATRERFNKILIPIYSRQ